MAFESDYDAVLATGARRDRLDAAITAMTASSEFTPLVRRLSCLRGVSTLTSFARDPDRTTGTLVLSDDQQGDPISTRAGTTVPRGSRKRPVMVRAPGRRLHPRLFLVKEDW